MELSAGLLCDWNDDRYSRLHQLIRGESAFADSLLGFEQNFMSPYRTFEEENPIPRLADVASSLISSGQVDHVIHVVASNLYLHGAVRYSEKLSIRHLTKNAGLTKQGLECPLQPRAFGAIPSGEHCYQVRAASDALASRTASVSYALLLLEIGKIPKIKREEMAFRIENLGYREDLSAVLEDILIYLP